MRILKRMLIMFLILIVVVIVTFFTIGFSLSAPNYNGPVSDHFDGKEFINPGGVKQKGFGDLLKWMTNREQGEWKETNQIQKVVPRQLVENGTIITFVNHSTFLIQTNGINILTDPIWSERASPFSWMGPKRMKPASIDFDKLPSIDIILISHNHYDHLDINTLKRLVDKFNPKLVVPLGVGLYLKNEGLENYVELDWWNEFALNDSVQFESVPAQHFSSRGMFDRNTTLWCGYVIKKKNGNIYFAGDTGYNENIFKEIGEKFGPFEVSMIPIGAYKPLWFMSPIHVSPEEAVKIHIDVKSNLSIAMHYGTFPLADDSMDDPVVDLKAAMKKFNLENFVVIDGEWIIDSSN